MSICLSQPASYPPSIPAMSTLAHCPSCPSNYVGKAPPTSQTHHHQQQQRNVGPASTHFHSETTHHHCHHPTAEMTEELSGRQGISITNTTITITRQQQQLSASERDARTGVISRPRTPPPRYLRPAKGCLKKKKKKEEEDEQGGGLFPGITACHFHYKKDANSKTKASLASPPALARCIITRTPCLPQGQHDDSKAWRQRRAARGERRAGLLGLERDIWAERGWNSAGLGEDTPMDGMSDEMDALAARWRARQLDFERRLNDQHSLAERNRHQVEMETRRLYGADGMTARAFVALRVQRLRTGMLP